MAAGQRLSLSPVCSNPLRPNILQPAPTFSEETPTFFLTMGPSSTHTTSLRIYGWHTRLSSPGTLPARPLRCSAWSWPPPPFPRPFV